MSSTPPEIEQFDLMTGIDQVLSKHLLDIMIFLGLLEIAFSGFAFVDRLNPTVESVFDIVDIFADGKFWAGCFLFSGALMLMSVRRPAIRAIATALASGAFGVWGLLCVIKSFSAATPISWAIGFAVMACGWVAYKLCLIWGLLAFDPEKMR